MDSQRLLQSTNLFNGVSKSKKSKSPALTVNFGNRSYTQPTAAVLGASTTATQQPQAAPRTAQIQQPAPAVSYAPQIAAYDQAAASLNKQENKAKSNVNSLFAGSKKQLNVAKNQANRYLDVESDRLDTEKNAAIRDNDESTRNLIQSTNNLLGTYGASDSSAGQTAQYAIHRTHTQARTEIISQAQALAADVGLRRQDVVDQFSTEVANLEMWKNTELTSIVNEFSQLKAEIAQNRALTQAQQAQAIAQAQQNAAAYIEQIDQGYGSNYNSIVEKAKGLELQSPRIGSTLQNSGLQIQGTGSYRGGF